MSLRLGKVLVTASGVAWLGAAVAKASGDGSLTAGAVGATGARVGSTIAGALAATEPNGKAAAADDCGAGLRARMTTAATAAAMNKTTAVAPIIKPGRRLVSGRVWLQGAAVPVVAWADV